MGAPARRVRHTIEGRLGELVDHLDAFEGPVPGDALASLLAEGFHAEDLTRWIAFDERTRVRTLVHRTAHYEVLVLGWLPGQESSVHDHGASACAFRVVEGRAWERVWPAEGDGDDGDPERLRVHAPGAIVSRHAEAVHQVGNAGITPLVTLHVYSPPLSFGGVAPAERVV